MIVQKDGERNGTSSICDNRKLAVRRCCSSCCRSTHHCRRAKRNQRRTALPMPSPLGLTTSSEEVAWRHPLSSSDDGTPTLPWLRGSHLCEDPRELLRHPYANCSSLSMSFVRFVAFRTSDRRVRRKCRRMCVSPGQS